MHLLLEIESVTIKVGSDQAFYLADDQYFQL